MIGRLKTKKKDTTTQFMFDIEEVVSYFKEGNYIERPYKIAENVDENDKLSKEIRRALEHVEWIKGFEYIDQLYMIYHGNNAQQMKTLFHKYIELSVSITGKEGHHNQGNDEIENYVMRDEENNTLYILRVGSDLIKACVPLENQDELKHVFSTLNSFIYKREK